MARRRQRQIMSTHPRMTARNQSAPHPPIPPTGQLGQAASGQAVISSRASRATVPQSTTGSGIVSYVPPPFATRAIVADKVQRKSDEYRAEQMSRISYCSHSQHNRLDDIFWRIGVSTFFGGLYLVQQQHQQSAEIRDEIRLLKYPMIRSNESYAQHVAHLERAQRGLLYYPQYDLDELRTMVADRGGRLQLPESRSGKDTAVEWLMKADETPAFNFLALPTELGELVLEFHYSSYHEVLQHPTQPPITKVSRAVRAQALPLFYNTCQFVVDLYWDATRREVKVCPWTTKWLLESVRAQWRHVQHLVLRMSETHLQHWHQPPTLGYTVVFLFCIAVKPRELQGYIVDDIDMLPANERGLRLGCQEWLQSTAEVLSSTLLQSSEGEGFEVSYLGFREMLNVLTILLRRRRN